MKKILVPTDFSPCAANAVDFAVRSAEIFPADIVLIHAFEIRGNMNTDYVGVNLEFNQALWDNADQKLIAEKKRIAATSQVTVTTQVFRGTVKDALSEATDIFGAQLIVMGTSGSEGLKEKIYGTKTASVLGSSNIPVLVVPADYKWKKPGKFLVATNHFEKEPAVLDFVFELAGLYLAQVSVAVFTDEDDDKASVYLEHTRNAPQYEKFLKNRYRENALSVSHIFGTDFEETLQKHIRETQTDVLVMISYHREEGILARLLNPGKTKKMSHHTRIPLLALSNER